MVSPRSQPYSPSSITDAIPVLDRLKQCILQLDRQGRLLWLNDSACGLFKRNKADCIGQPWHQLFSLLRADGRRIEPGKCALELSLSDGQDRPIPASQLERIGDSSPSPVVSGDCLITASPTGEADGCLLVLEDITARYRSERVQTWETTVLTLISSGASLPLVLQSIALGVETIQNQAKTAILMATADANHLECVCAPSLPESLTRAVSAEGIRANAGPSGFAAFSGEPVFVHDIHQDPRWAEHDALAAAYNLTACWVVPVMDAFNQDVLATFNLYYEQAKTPDQDDLGIIKRAIHLISFALERDSVSRERDESEAKFRQLAEQIDEVFWLSNANGKIIYVSPAFERIWGLSCEVLYQSPWVWQESIIDEDRPRVVQAMAMQNSGDYQIEYRIRRPDGNLVWVEDRAFPVVDDQGK